MEKKNVGEAVFVRHAAARRARAEFQSGSVCRFLHYIPHDLAYKIALCQKIYKIRFFSHTSQPMVL